MGAEESVRAWSSDVAGVAEVLRARFTSHAYPPHTHDTWTLLLVDTGAVRFDLDRREHGALGDRVTLLPPGVPHDGRATTAAGFHKRVVYLDPDVLDPRRVGAAVDHPGWVDGTLRAEVSRLHEALVDPAEAFEAEDRLASVAARLDALLGAPQPSRHVDHGTASRLRELLDARTGTGLTLVEAARLVGVSPTHLVRSFSAAYGIAPHRYLTGRRIDRARRLLLAGTPPASVAVAVGFHDQPHLTRQFRRYLGVTPAAYARSARS
ncbi:helix-turn-helix transcriptional regulator [Nocardioides dongxiaopingii]|uniref:helix-turn-helix transcriptional regulator n=1 Tax=Nocardioides TaxID=1839 RepID=UPI001FEA1E04|nr:MULTISPECIES: AraC family transcriptional regulator [Nocardioides]